VNAIKSLLLTSALVCSGNTFAQSAHDKEASATVKEGAAIIELGGAAGWNIKDRSWNSGPDVAVEITPIENWLELEVGVTPLFRRHRSAEWDTDLLFKKPWDLSKQFEFMAGLGPEWVYTKEPGMRRNSIAAEAVLDVMYWPGSKRRFGMFIEPGYEYNFARGHEKSFGVTAGLLIAIR
jgi:hypothetical protein